MKHDAEDAVFRVAVKERDEYTCQRCWMRLPEGSPYLHCAHMFGRAKLATRFDPENACALCGLCHHVLDTNPDVKRAFFERRLGEEKFAALELRSNQVVKGMAS